MKNKKEFPFTKLQLLWLDRLEKYPERQMSFRLGELSKDDTGKGPMKYRACCLGEAAICMKLIQKKSPRSLLLVDQIRETDKDFASTGGLPLTFKKLSLRQSSGELKERVKIKNNEYFSLASMNDSCISWTDIAKYIRENPENVFTNLEEIK